MSTATIFPITNDMVQIPVAKLERMLAPLYDITLKVNQIEIDEDISPDFRQLDKTEITPKILTAIKEAKEAPESDFVNL